MATPSPGLDRAVLKLIETCSTRAGALPEEIAALTNAAGVALPQDYLDLMSYSDGIEGPIGNENYIALWPIGQLMEATRGYGLTTQLPGFLLIGSDGGDTGYAYDTRTREMKIVQLSLSQLDNDPIRTVAWNLLEFLSYLRDYHYDPPRDSRYPRERMPMDAEIATLTARCETRAGAFLAILSDVESKFGIQLPSDYKAVMLQTNGLEGWIGDNYVQLWSAEDVMSHGVYERAPFLLFIGSDGGGEGFAYDTRLPGTPIVNLPFIGMEGEQPRVLGRTFVEFLQRLEAAPLF